VSGKLWIGDPAVLGHQRWNFRNPYIWIVPGDDPHGQPGQAFAKKTNYIWVLVANEDFETDADGALVDFYFQSFSTELGGLTLKFVGTSRIDLPRRSKDSVLCVVPFRPAHAGHGCLVCVIRHSIDPLPERWDVGLRGQWLSQVGQRNIEVIDTEAERLTATPFEVSASFSEKPRITLHIDRPDLAEAELSQLLWSSGLPGTLIRTNDAARVGLSETATASGAWWETSSLTIDIPPGGSRFIFLLSETLPGPQGFDVFDAVSFANGHRIGGVAALVVRR
jgi:hypothetical protein